MQYLYILNESIYERVKGCHNSSINSSRVQYKDHGGHPSHKKYIYTLIFWSDPNK